MLAVAAQSVLGVSVPFAGHLDPCRCAGGQPVGGGGGHCEVDLRDQHTPGGCWAQVGFRLLTVIMGGLAESEVTPELPSVQLHRLAPRVVLDLSAAIMKAA